MNPKNLKPWLRLGLCLLLLALAFGCRGIDVPLTIDEYNPNVAPMNPYQGVRANLLPVTNVAAYADCKGYKSPYFLDTYQIRGSMLPEYFRQVFERGFAAAGMDISPAGDRDPARADIQITLLVISSAEYKFTLRIYRNQAIAFQKTYSAVEPPLQENDRSRDALRDRAYRMADGAVQTVLADPEFTKAIQAAQAG